MPDDTEPHDARVVVDLEQWIKDHEHEEGPRWERRRKLIALWHDLPCEELLMDLNVGLQMAQYKHHMETGKGPT